MPNVLIAGNGFVGIEVARLFCEAGWDVTAISRSGENDSSHSSGSSLANRICDITDRSQVESLRKDFANRDLLIDCVSSGRGGAAVYRSVYFEGAKNLLECLQPKVMIFVSSTSVYAQTDGAWVNEKSAAEPSRETGEILRETENLVLENGGGVARLAGIYGPERSVLLRKFFSGEAKIEGDGGRWMNQIHRDDAARALFHLGSGFVNGVAENFANGDLTRGIYNVCDDSPMTQIACYRWLAEHFKKSLPPFCEPDLNRKRGWTSKRVSNEKLRATSWECRYTSFQSAVENDSRLLEML